MGKAGLLVVWVGGEAPKAMLDVSPSEFKKSPGPMSKCVSLHLMATLPGREVFFKLLFICIKGRHSLIRFWPITPRAWREWRGEGL